MFQAHLKGMIFKGGYTRTNIADEHLKMTKIFVILAHGFQVGTIFGDLWFVFRDVKQKRGPPYDHFPRPYSRNHKAHEAKYMITRVVNFYILRQKVNTVLQYVH